MHSLAKNCALCGEKMCSFSGGNLCSLFYHLQLVIQLEEYFDFDDEEYQIIEDYNKQMKKTKEYPFKFKDDCSLIVASVAQKLFAKVH